ncbi:Osteopetrosis-associated transmembrane like protein [Argiope bruennichi]|uniref:Osteopetrosis-associated transmembrane like protein n=2 Tax=Argiope bruennichi TaxID=94029 RepID=A0A8T0FEI5_ARGBR|nr:Osteopetrosis-associated transmembrane like protein [Argiope bruennichi]
MNCGKSHTALNAAYQHLKNQTQKCQSYFFGSDQLSIVDIVYKNGIDLWQKGYCQNCYDHYNETERFFQASNELILCMETTNSTSNVAENSTCIKCHDAYANVSVSYKKFVQWKKDFVGGICMDIVDAMNMSRREWSEYNCAVGFDLTMGFPNILTALTVGSTPLMFYLLAKNISRLEDVKLVRPKRKITVVTVPPPVEE